MNDPLLSDRLAQLAMAIGERKLVDALAAFVRTAEDDAIVRVNPIRFGAERGFAARAVVDMFLHARKLGLVTMECSTCARAVARSSSGSPRSPAPRLTFSARFAASIATPT